MIRTLIIEDEEPAAFRLKKLLKELNPEIEVVDIIDSVDSSVKWFKVNQHPDLLLLDIQLADGLSFDIFKHVKVESFVIFTTAYDEYAIKAFELNSIDYLLKPVDRAKLSVSLNKYETLKGPKPTFDINELISTIEGKKTTYKKRFAINIGNKIRSVETKDVIQFYSMDKSTFLVASSGKFYPIDFSLDNLEKLLDPDYFFRINRQSIINYFAIEKINILSKSRVELRIQGSDQGILVSTSKTHSFREWLDR